jgi:hypothetical protein
MRATMKGARLSATMIVGSSLLPQVEAPGPNQTDNGLQHHHLHYMGIPIFSEKVGHAWKSTLINVGVRDLRNLEPAEGVGDSAPAYANVDAVELLLSFALDVID